MKKSSSKFLGIVVFVLLCGIFIVPEKTKIICILALAMLMVQFFIGNRNMRITNQSVILLWILFLIIGAMMSLINGLNLNTAIEFAISIFIGGIIGNVYINEPSRKAIIKAIFLVAVVALVGSVMQITVPGILSKITSTTLGPEKYYYFRDFTSYGALVGFSYQTGVNGFYLAVLAGMVFCYFLQLKPNQSFCRLVTIILFVGVYALVLLTKKRSQLLTVLLLVIALYVIYNRKNALKVLTISGILILGAAVILVFTETGQTIIARTFGEGASLTGRDRIYPILWENFKRSPFFGNGFGYTLKTVKDFTNGHNVYLQVLSENGILGFGIYMGIIVSCLLQAYRLLKELIRAKEDSFLCSVCLYLEGLFVLNGMFGNPLYDVFPVIVFMIASGIVSSQLKARKVVAKGNK